MKSILLIGLGLYGRHIAEKLHELRHEVLAVDKEEKRVDAVLPYVTRGLIADSTNPSFLESLGIPNFDLCIVAIGDDFQASLETTSLLKEMGARYVVARAARGIHEKFLLRNGADAAVYPEKQLAIWTAIRYSSDKIFDYFELDKDHGVYEIAVPEDWAGKTVGELDVRKRYHVNMMAVKHSGQIDAGITPQTRLSAGDRVLILGKNEDVQKYFKL